MAKFDIRMNNDGKCFVVTDNATKKSYNCGFSFHRGHGDFHEFYVDVSNVPGAKLKKWWTMPTKFTKDESTGKFTPNVLELTFQDDLAGKKNKYTDILSMF